MAVSWRNNSRVPSHCLTGPTEALCFHLFTETHPSQHICAYHTHAYIYTNTHMHIHSTAYGAHAYIHTSYARLHTYMHTCMRLCMHMSISRCPHIYTFTHMCINMYMWTHIHTLVTTVQVSGREKEGAGKKKKKKPRQCENRAESNEKPHGGKRPPMVARPCSAHLSPSPWCPLCHAWFCPGGPCSCPDWTGRDSCLDCRLLMRDNMSRCPAEYCSMTSITSYGRRLSLNFRLDTKNRITLQRWTDHEFQTEATLPGASSHIHLSPSNSSKTTIPGK